MALHFALRNKQEDSTDSLVYVLEPYRLMDTLNGLPETLLAQANWEKHLETHPDDAEEDVAFGYLPSDREEGLVELPRVPLVLQFPHLSRRVAAQRSQFIVFGSDPSWLSEEADKPDSCIRTITISGQHTKAIRAEVRECGVTESVIFPDLDGLGRELKQLWEDRQ